MRPSTSTFPFFGLIAIIIWRNISALDLSVYSNLVKSTFIKEAIFPAVFPSLPSQLLWVEYEGKIPVRLGNELKPSQVKNKPFVHYQAEDYSFYTLSMIDPDAVSDRNQNISQLNHYLVGNIPGNDAVGGEILAEYLGAQPPEGTDFHRYIFYVFKQPDMLLFDEIQIKDEADVTARFNFDLKQFVDKYDLGQPIAANFFFARFQTRTTNDNQNLLRKSGC